jgi:hypothetical protein
MEFVARYSSHRTMSEASWFSGVVVIIIIIIIIIHAVLYE